MLNKYYFKMKSSYSNNKIFFILIFLLIFISFSSQNYMFIAQSNRTDFDLEPFNINFTYLDCNIMIPDLFSPIILLYPKYTAGLWREFEDIEFETPLSTSKITGFAYEKRNPLFYMAKLYKNIENNKDNCYFGLSKLLLNITDKELSDLNNLKILKDEEEINETIFSFNKWDLNDTIKTELYYGYSHPDFNSNDGIIGTCTNAENNSFWSCIFNNMTFQNKTISLMKENNEYYKIYFSSNVHDIYFPNDFQKKFENATEGNCSLEILDEKSDSTLACQNYLEIEENYLPITLNNENMSITLQIDNYQRFSETENEKLKKYSRILFRPHIKDPIFPLIMFKQFHVQFNGESNTINFYTKDKSILKVKTEPKKDSSSDSGSSGLKVFLIILLIIILLAMGFGIFYFVKKKLKNSVENDINKFNKFEDEEENGKIMNEKKVY